jgi:hypothetical protein
MTQTLESQLLMEIHELGDTMVRLDAWMQAARKRQEWTQIGEFEEMRLAAQLRRSNLMRDAWVPRKDLRGPRT